LSPDCRSDPQHIKVRAIQGKEAVTYLDPGLLTGSLSYVHALISAAVTTSVAPDLNQQLAVAN
jgi:hypothetical protein